MREKLKALNEGNSWDFSLASYPKCPHCGSEYKFDEQEDWSFYSCEDGEEKKIECPACDESYTVTTNISFTFSTDEQPDEDEED